MKSLKMKVCTFLLGMMLGGAIYADNVEVPLEVGIDDDTPVIPEVGKGPIMPSLWQDGSELTFLSSHDDYTLELRQGGVVVYSTFVSSSTSTIVLPSTLQGEYEIRLYGDESYYLFGYITL